MTVVRLGAFADCAQPAGEQAGVGISVEQFAVLADGRRIVFDERGFSGSVSPPQPDPWTPMTRQQLDQSVRNVVLPDDDEDAEPLPWPWVVRRLRELGVTTTVQELKTLPYNVVLSERLRARVPR